MDSLLLEYKGVVKWDDPKKPIFTVRRQVAMKNRYMAERMTLVAEHGHYVHSDREDIHPAFGIKHNRDDTHYAPGELDYASEDDPEATSSDEDSDGDGCALGE
jgi:hypothetical protein